MSTIPPCGICGSSVHYVRVKAPRMVSDVAPTIENQRVCDNPQCPSNTGDMSLADVV